MNEPIGEELLYVIRIANSRLNGKNLNESQKEQNESFRKEIQETDECKYSASFLFSLSQFQQAVAKFRNKRPLDGGKKKRFQLLNSSDTEFDITYDNDALGQLSNKEAVDQTTGSEFAQDTLYRTKKEVMAEVISKSKQFKAEKKQEKYIVETLIEDIDAEFMQVLPTLPKKNLFKEPIRTLSLKDSQVDGNKNPFERTRELHTVGSTREDSISELNDTDLTGNLSLLKKRKERTGNYENVKVTAGMSYSTASGQTMNNTDSSAEQDTNETKDRGFPKAYVPEIFEEFLNRLLPNDILQEQYLDTLVTQAVERHNDGSSERLLTFIFHALEVVVQRDNRPDDLTRTLDTTKALVQKIRMLLSYENNHQLGDFVDRVKAKLSEPLLVATSAQEDRQSILDGIDGVIDLSCKLDSNLFLLLFSVSRLSSLKNTISPTISNLIFLIGQWLTRMKVSCLHQIRKGLSLIQLFLPHIEASECFVPEMITYCFSTLSLFVREDSVIRDTLSLYNFSQSESLQRMIRQTIVNDSKQLWVEEEGKTDVIFRVFACNGVSCKSNESEDWRELSKMLCDLFVTCRDIIIRLCRIFKSFDAFHGLILPFMKGLHEISEDEEIWPALRIDSESFASSLKEMIHVTEERGLKPLQLYYKKSSSLPVEYEPKLKDNIRWQNSHRLKQHVRKEKKKTMKWLQLETNRQQQEKLSQKKNEDLYRAKRAKEATSFLQQQQENWNKQEKKWKNVKKSSL